MRAEPLDLQCHVVGNRARKTIVSGNFVSLIAAVVLYILAVGDVKGFAFTLGLTTVFDLTVTFLVTAPVVILAARRKFFAKPSVNGLGKVFELVEQRRAAGEHLAADSGWYNQRMLATKRAAGGDAGEEEETGQPNHSTTKTSSTISLEESIASEPKVPEHLRRRFAEDAYEDEGEGDSDGSHTTTRGQEDK